MPEGSSSGSTGPGSPRLAAGLGRHLGWAELVEAEDIALRGRVNWRLQEAGLPLPNAPGPRVAAPEQPVIDSARHGPPLAPLDDAKPHAPLEEPESDNRSLRVNLISEIFHKLDSESGGRLRESGGRLRAREMLCFARLLGFEGSVEEWVKEYRTLCHVSGWDAAVGVDLLQFAEFVEDESGTGYCTTSELYSFQEDLFSVGPLCSGEEEDSLPSASLELKMPLPPGRFNPPRRVQSEATREFEVDIDRLVQERLENSHHERSCASKRLHKHAEYHGTCLGMTDGFLRWNTQWILEVLGCGSLQRAELGPKSLDCEDCATCGGAMPCDPVPAGGRRWDPVHPGGEGWEGLGRGAPLPPKPQSAPPAAAAASGPEVPFVAAPRQLPRKPSLPRPMERPAAPG